MPTRCFRFVLAALVATTVAAPHANAAGDSGQALAILSAAKAAMGGAGWDKVGGWHERGRHGDVRYETFLDFGRYSLRFESARDGVTRVHGYNGSLVWDLAPTSGLTTSRDPARLAEARQSAYGSTFAFFFPRRFPARFAYLGVQADGGSTYDVVRVTPSDAVPMDVWVDRSTHLVARFVDRSGPQPVTATMSDYRRVQELSVPFAIEITDGNPAHTRHGQVEAISLEPVAPAQFDPPAG